MKDYSKTEIYMEVETNAGTHWLINYKRLVPDSVEPETLFYGRGAFDWTDAARDRREAWPDAVLVSEKVFNRVLSERQQQREPHA